MRVHRFFSRLAAVGLVAGVASACLPLANAQIGSTGTSAFGSRTLGGGTTTANRTGRSAGAANPASASGTSGIGGAAGQQAGPGTSGNSVTGSERYVRGNQKGNFVGADSGDASNPFSQQAAGANGMMGMSGMNGMGGMQMMNSLRQQQQNQQGRNQQTNKNNKLRPSFRVGYEIAPPLTTTFTARQQHRYSNLPALRNKGQIEVLIEGDTLVLRGQVGSAADKKLAEDLLSLEPEVTAVRNELEIVPGAASSPAGSSSLNSPARDSSVAVSAPRTVSQPVER